MGRPVEGVEGEDSAVRETGRFRTIEDRPLDRRREKRDLHRPHDEVVFNAELARDVLNGLDLATVDHAQVGVSPRQGAEKRVLLRQDERAVTASSPANYFLR